MPELEIRLTHRDGADYLARFEYRAPGAPPTTHEAAIRLDPTVLNRCAADPHAYGRSLAAALFPDGPLRNAWEAARPAAGPPLRVRLVLPQADSGLRRVRWEAIHDPSTGAILSTDQGVWFARHLTSTDPRPVRLRTKPALRVLVAMAAPADIDNLLVGTRAFTVDDRFTPDLELPAVRDALGGLTKAVTILPDPTHGRATLHNIVDHLRQGYDAFYLIAHGVLDGDIPKLLLEDNAGNGEQVDGRELAREIGQLWHRPGLIVLSSCQSAGPIRPYRAPAVGQRGADDDVDAALGAELGRVGVAAVISMLGNVYQETARTFARRFFEAIAADGLIDKAVGEARHAVRGQPDTWAPVLATRQEDARLWRGEATASPGGFAGWPALLRKLRLGQCVPVLGSGLLERLIGPTRELARTWAEQDNVALTRDSQLDLPQVAQYLLITNGREYVQERYQEVLSAAVNFRWPVSAATTLQERLAEAVAQYPSKDQPDGHALLARLNCPLYITTNPDGLLQAGLVAAKRPPIEQLCNWLTSADNPPGFPPDGPTKPTAATPLVCQLFGHLSNPSSVVLTEDDYFKFLIGMSRVSANPTPSFVQKILTRSTLLFLGFRINDWDFRAFLSFLLSREAAKSRKDFGLRDVAVQIDPAEDDAPNPDQVRDYLKSRFGRADIDIYFGSADTFLEELYDQWPSTP